MKDNFQSKEFLKELKELLTKKEPIEDIMTSEQVCSLLDICKDVLTEFDKDGITFPFFLTDKSRKKMYRKSEINKYLEGRFKTKLKI